MIEIKQVLKIDRINRVNWIIDISNYIDKFDYSVESTYDNRMRRVHSNILVSSVINISFYSPFVGKDM